MGYVGGYADILRSVYLTLFLDTWKPGKFHIGVKNEAMVDALWICISLSHCGIEVSHCVVYSYFCVRLLRCSFYSNGHTRASECGMSNSYRLSRFLVLIVFYERPENTTLIFMTSWLFPYDRQKFKLDRCLENQGFVEWHQLNRFQVGDIMYLSSIELGKHGLKTKRIPIQRKK